MSGSDRFLEGRHAIVTGGGRGIGAAIAEALVRRGAHVTITGRTVETLEQHAERLRTEHGARVFVAACDVADAAAVQDVFAGATRELGVPYILVNNAGQAHSASFTKMSQDVWNRMIAVNLTGTYLCISQVLPAMLDARAGRIINIASTAGLRGYKTMTAYCAAKHGVVGMTRALALETAARGVTINAVCPGYTDTNIAQSAVENLVAAKGITRDEALALLLRSIPQGRLTTPAEVAGAVEWLCSANAAPVTGIALPIAGGEVL